MAADMSMSSMLPFGQHTDVADALVMQAAKDVVPRIKFTHVTLPDKQTSKTAFILDNVLTPEVRSRTAMTMNFHTYVRPC